MTKTILILGASGKIGQHAAFAFREAGWHVRNYDRARGNMIAAAKGVDIIVNGLNPPNYHNWTKLIPEITSQVISAAKASGASVIIPGNVYNFGDTPGVWSESTPQLANSRKGRIRVEMENAYRESGVRTIVLRAGNFIDPMRNGDVMSLVFLRSIAKGRITSPGRPDAKQAFCYLPDWARAAVALAEIQERLSTFEDIPFSGHTFTTRELQLELEETLKQKIKLVGFPWPVMKILAPFWELARELTEMRYLWNTNHQLDGKKFSSLLPNFKATDQHTVMIAGLPQQIHPDQTVPGSIAASLV